MSRLVQLYLGSNKSRTNAKIHTDQLIIISIEYQVGPMGSADILHIYTGMLTEVKAYTIIALLSIQCFAYIWWKIYLIPDIIDLKFVLFLFGLEYYTNIAYHPMRLAQILNSLKDSLTEAIVEGNIVFPSIQYFA